MSYQINNVQVYDSVRNLYLSTYDQAERAGLSTDNMHIYLRSEVKEALELKDTLTIGGVGLSNRDVPIMADDSIEEDEGKDGEFYSSIYIYDPNWMGIE